MSTNLTLLSVPRISKAGFESILKAQESPAAPVAGRLWELVKSYGLDPAIALGFFKHESTYGKKGVARATLNWGNIKVGSWAIREGLADSTYTTPDGRDFLLFRRRDDEQPGEEWLRSLKTWCELIFHTYIGKWGLNTVEEALTRYLGPGDAPKAYAADVNGSVAAWQQAYPYEGEGDDVTARLLAIEARLEKAEAALGDLGRRVLALEGAHF